MVLELASHEPLQNMVLILNVFYPVHRECARLQGFPDWFVVNPIDAFAYKQFGNSVSVPVIEAVISDFLEQNKDALGWE